jgi:hypothetical protein
MAHRGPFWCFPSTPTKLVSAADQNVLFSCITRFMFFTLDVSLRVGQFYTQAVVVDERQKQRVAENSNEFGTSASAERATRLQKCR